MTPLDRGGLPRLSFYLGGAERPLQDVAAVFCSWEGSSCGSAWHRPAPAGWNALFQLRATTRAGTGALVLKRGGRRALSVPDYRQPGRPNRTPSQGLEPCEGNTPHDPGTQGPSFDFSHGPCSSLILYKGQRGDPGVCLQST